MSTVNTACTAPAGPPASPLDLKRSGGQVRPGDVGVADRPQHRRRRGLDLHRPVEVEAGYASTSPEPGEGRRETTTTASERRQRRARRLAVAPAASSHSRTPGTSTAGNSFVIVASAEQREPSDRAVRDDERAARRA